MKKKEPASATERYLFERAVLRDTIVLDGGRMRAVLEVVSAHVAGLPPHDQENTLAVLLALLRGLDHPVQWVVRSDPVDLSDLARRVEFANPDLPVAIGYAEHLRSLSQRGVLHRRRCLAVVPADEGLTWWDAQAQLDARCQSLATRFGQLGWTAKRLGTEELNALLSGWWRPGDPATATFVAPETDWAVRGGLLASRLEPGLRKPSWRRRLRAAVPGRLGGRPLDPVSLESRRLGRDLETGTLAADFLCPAAVGSSRWTFRRADGEHRQEVSRTLKLTRYPRTVALAWLTRLVALPETLDVAVHVSPKDPARVLSRLAGQANRLAIAHAPARRGEKVADPEVETAIADIARTRLSITRGEQKLYDQALYVTVRAPNVDALAETQKRVEAELRALGVEWRECAFEQPEGFRATLPELDDAVRVTAVRDTASVARDFPLVVRSEAGKGVYLGRDRETGAPVLHDCFDFALDNGNLALIGPAGSGKSVSAKLLALRHYYAGVHAYVIDPEGEYARVALALGGSVVRFSVRSLVTTLNPFDLPPVETLDDGTESDPVAEQSQFVVGLVQKMVGGLSAQERALVDTAVSWVYSRAVAGYTPTVGDLYEALSDLPDGGAVAGRLRPWADGSLRHLFSGQTDADLVRAMRADFVVFDVSEVAVHDNPNVLPAVMRVLTNHVWAEIRREKRPRLLIVDEAATMLKDPSGARFVGEMARRVRKHYGALVTIVQDIAHLQGSPDGLDALRQAGTKLILRHGADAVGGVQAAFGLSQDERMDLLACGKGEGILIGRGGRRPVAIQTTPAEYPLVTTRPDETATRSAPPAPASHATVEPSPATAPGPA